MVLDYSSWLFESSDEESVIAQTLRHEEEQRSDDNFLVLLADSIREDLHLNSWTSQFDDLMGTIVPGRGQDALFLRELYGSGKYFWAYRNHFENLELYFERAGWKTFTKAFSGIPHLFKFNGFFVKELTQWDIEKRSENILKYLKSGESSPTKVPYLAKFLTEEDTRLASGIVASSKYGV